MSVPDVRVVVRSLIHPHVIDLHGHVPLLHHVAEAGIERARARRVVAIVALGAPLGGVVRESPRGRDGGVQYEIGRLVGYDRPHERIDRFVLDRIGVNPIGTVAVSRHAVHVGIGSGAVSLGEPIEASAVPRLPFEAEGVGLLEVGGGHLLERADGVGLKGLLGVAGDRFALLGDVHVRAVEERIEGRVALGLESFVPGLGEEFGVARFADRVVAEDGRAGLRTVGLYARCHLQGHIHVRQINRGNGIGQRSSRIPHHTLDDIDLGRPPSLSRIQSVMIRLVARAHALRLLPLPIARIVTPRPNVIRAGQIRRPTQIPEHPYGGPQPTDERISGQYHVEFDDPAGEAEFIPRLYHSRFVMLRLVFPFPVDGVVAIPFRLADLGGDAEHPVFVGGDHGGIVKVEGSSPGRRIVVVGLVQRGPHGIVTVGEGTVRDVELVRHDQFIRRSVDETLGRARLLGRVRIDPRRVGAEEKVPPSTSSRHCHYRRGRGGGGGTRAASVRASRHGMYPSRA
mmetsp:Transcript_27955/g.82187  ORF Transcript_27955/g.82187 Transcript_27955/m.82187 type:complete len:512 (+) Transcript_27955:997-2532(+)